MSALNEFLQSLHEEIEKITPEEVQNFKLAEICGETPIVQIDDEDLKKLLVLSYKKRDALKARVMEIQAKLNQTDSIKEAKSLHLEIQKEMEVQSVILVLKNIFFFLIRQKYNIHEQKKIEIRQDWTIVESFDFMKRLSELSELYEEIQETIN